MLDDWCDCNVDNISEESLPEKNPKLDVDKIKNPNYYTMGGVECIDIIKELFGYDEAIAFCKGNIVKYSIRLGKKYKPGTDGFEQDVIKIHRYIEMKKQLEQEWDEDLGKTS